jgi:hypothetical protein
MISKSNTTVSYRILVCYDQRIMSYKQTLWNYLKPLLGGRYRRRRSSPEGCSKSPTKRWQEGRWKDTFDGTYQKGGQRGLEGGKTPPVCERPSQNGIPESLTSLRRFSRRLFGDRCLLTYIAFWRLKSLPCMLLKLSHPYPFPACPTYICSQLDTVFALSVT